jgi:hypothetical protein
MCGARAESHRVGGKPIQQIREWVIGHMR